MMYRLYLAGQWGRRDEIAGYARLLRDDGHEVVSRWHDELMGNDAATNEENWRTWANADLDDVMKANTFVAFTEEPGTMARGGRHVEWGFACAVVKVMKDGLLFVVGPIESQFYALRSARVDDIDALREGLQRLAAAQ